MQDNQLIKLIIATVKAGLPTEWTTLNAEVAASYQPTQQGVTTNPAAFLFKIGDVRYGFLKRHSEWVPDGSEAGGAMVHTESQWYETTFQISTLVLQTATNVNQLTASDLCNTVAGILQGDAGREAMQAQGVGILRVGAVRNPSFTDDRDRFEYSPNFDFTVTHERVRLSTNPVVETFELDIKRV